MARSHFASISLLFAATSASVAATPNAWDQYNHMLRESCPNRHVEWVLDGGYDELLAAFEATLTPAERTRIETLADLKRQCASEQIGFSCEMARSLAAYRTLHLLPRFVAYGCNHVNCEEPASCSQFPKLP